jgi:hypothetical protein
MGSSGGGAHRRKPGGRARSGSGGAAPAAPRHSRARLRSGQSHHLGAEAAAVIHPAPGVKPCLGENRLSAGEEIADAIGEPLVRARPAASGGAIAGLDRLEADDFRKLADRLEQRPAAGAQIADLVDRACRPVQAGLAGYALEMGQQARFRSEGSRQTIHDNQI